MGGSRKALNRSQTWKKQTVSNPNFVKPGRPDKEKASKIEGEQVVEAKPVVKQDALVIVNLGNDEDRTDIPYIFKKLPQSMEEFTELMDKTLKKSKSKDKSGTISLILKRMRDYNHPDGTLTDKDDKSDKWTKYNKFVIALAGTWLKTDEKDDSKKVYQQHLQEIVSSPEFAQVVVKFLQVRLNGIVEVLKVIRVQNDQNDLKSECDHAKILVCFIECQSIFVNIFGNPQCKSFDLIEAVASQIYNLVADRIFRDEDQEKRQESLSLLIKIVKTHVKIMKVQKKCLTLSLNYILIKLFKSKKLNSKQMEKLKKINESYFTLINKLVPNSQIVLEEVRKAAGEKVLGKRLFREQSGLSLEYMAIRQEFPKPLASYDPLIEDEFLMRVPKKDKYDEKALKQKTRKMEKDAVRELKKDSFAIQKQRHLERDQRRNVTGKKQVKYGHVKDEV